MYEYIIGTIIDKKENYIVIDNNGMGYKIYVTGELKSKLLENEKFKLYIYFHVREEEQYFYGFLNEFDKEIFEMLIGVSGLGVKMAIKVFDQMNSKTLVRNVYRENIVELKKIKGLGEKLIKKIFLELKSKMSIYIEGMDQSEIEENNPIESELKQALFSLGYKEIQIQQVFNEFSPKDGYSLESSLKEALSYLNKFK